MSIYFSCNFQWIRREIKKQCEFRFCQRISNSHSMRKRKLRTTSALRFTSYIIMSKYSTLYSVLDYLRLIFHDVFRVANLCGHVIHSYSDKGISWVYSVANSFGTGPVPKRDYFLIRRSRNRTRSGTDWRNDEKIPYNLEDNPPRFWDQNQLEPAPCFYSISYPNQWLCTRITSYSFEQPIKSRDTDLYASKRMKGVLSLPVTVRHHSCHELGPSQPQGSIQCIS